MFGWMKKEKAAEATVKEKEAAREPAAVPAAGLKVKIKERKGCAVHMAVEVPADRVGETLEESFSRVRAKVKMPGFRPGKVPMDVIKKNFLDAAWEDALDHLLRESVHEAVEKEQIHLMAVPTVNDIKGTPGSALKFEVTAECAPEVTVKDYKGLPLRKKVEPVTDADVEKRMGELRESHAKLILSKDAVVSSKHFVEVDYTSFIDGQPVPNGTAKSQLIEMSASQSVAGFTEGLLGAKDGETREFPVTFPADHPQKKLAGKTLQFKVTVTAVKEKESPALDDDFAKDVGATDLADLRAKVRKEIELARTRSARQDLEKQVIDELLKRHVFDVPPSQVTERANQLTEQLKRYLSERGASEEEWKANEASLTERNRPEAERQVRLSYVLARILEIEKIAVSDQDIETQVRRVLDAFGGDRHADAQKWMNERRESIRAQLREERLFDLLIQNANVTETAAA